MRATIGAGQGGAQISKFELSHAVALFSQQTVVINNLWQVYVVATFAAAGFGISVSLAISQAIAITTGFLAFTFGNWKLLKQGLSVNVKLGSEISSVVRADLLNPFNSSINALAATANPPIISLCIHAFIDTCVVIAIWSHVPDALTFFQNVWGGLLGAISTL